MTIIEAISKILTTDRGRNNKPVVLKELENGCIVCISHELNRAGYLLLCRSGKKVGAHRLVYEHFYGPIPDGMLVCHHCDNPPCLNPEDFFIGTDADNSRDMAQKGRSHKTYGQTWSRGEKNSHVKLTADQVYIIREKYRTGDYTYKELGKECGVNTSQIGRIVNNKSWKHLNDPEHDHV